MRFVKFLILSVLMTAGFVAVLFLEDPFSHILPSFLADHLGYVYLLLFPVIWFLLIYRLKKKIFTK